MVGHYWLRAPSLAPEALQAVIQAEIDHVKSFAERVHNKEIAPPGGGRYTDVLVVGIGGSALGPQLISDALGGLGGKLAENHGWAFPFQLFGVIGIVYSIFLLMMLRDPPKVIGADAKSATSQHVGFWEDICFCFAFYVFEL